jgi:hypothetical protein
MKLIKKADLSMHDGLLIGPDNDVLSCPDLLDEINELVDLAELITFTKANATAIEMKADGSVVKFTPAKIEAPRIVSKDEAPGTPLADEMKASAIAQAEEFLNVQQYGDINDHLGRYPNIAMFLDKDYILVDSGDYCSLERFKTDPLLLTESFIIDTVKAYHEPAMRKLIAGVVIAR